MPEICFVWQRHLIRNNSFYLTGAHSHNVHSKFVYALIFLHNFLNATRFLQPVIIWITTTTSRSSLTRNSQKQRPANLLDSSDLHSTPEHDQLQQSTSSFNQQTSTFFSVAELLNSELRKTEKPQLDILRTWSRQPTTSTYTSANSTSYTLIST